MTELSSALANLEAAWLRNGMPHTDWLTPGRPAFAVEAVLAAVGLPAPVEIIEWFGWRNGAAVSLQEGDVRPALGLGSFEPFSLVQALNERVVMIETAAFLEQDPNAMREDFPLWEHAWLPVARTVGGELLTAELGAGSTVPVRVVSWWDEDFKVVRAESLAEVVERWIEWLDAYCEWDPALRSWSYDFVALPLDVKLSGLT